MGTTPFVDFLLLMTGTCCLTLGWLFRSLRGDKLEDRAYDQGWDDCLDDMSRNPARPESLTSKPSPEPTSKAIPKSEPSPQPMPPSPPEPLPRPSPPFTPMPMPSPPFTPVPKSSPKPPPSSWVWNDKSGHWDLADDVQSTFIRALAYAPLEDIPALFG